MPEMIPVGNTGIQPNPVGSLSALIAAKSGMIGLQQQQQNLQTGQYNQQAAQATAQQDQQKNSELQALAQFTKSAAQDPSYQNADGSANVQKYQQDAMKVAPTYGQAYIGQMTQNFNGSVENRKAMLALTKEQQGMVQSGVQSIAQGADATTELSRLRGVSADPGYQNMLDNLLSHKPNTGMMPDVQAKQAEQQWAAALSAHLGGPALATAGTIDTGGQIKPVTTSPYTGAIAAAGAPINKTLSPQVISGPLTGAPTQIGGGQGTTAKPITGPGMQPYTGEQADIKDFQTEVGNIRRNADQAPLARNINQQILSLSRDAKTGPGSETWQHVIGAVGAPFGLSPSASYQEVGKFLEKNAINNMQSMGGPPSDARLSAAAAANGSTQFSPEALQAVTKFNDATTTALMQYRQGIDNTIGTGQNVDYTKLPAYKAAWAKNFDVNVYRVENAIRDGDGTELNKIKAQLGPKGLQQLAQKRQNLNELSQGQIPQ